jgi:indole-3-glycerol phosphate synthase
VSEDFLAAMAASSRMRAAAARAQLPERELLARALAGPRPPRLQLSPKGFDVIAEVKLRSPAAGALKRSDENLAARAGEYAAAGAAAVSVLTEPSRFDGSLLHLQQVSSALAQRIPAMRKDFLVDAYQVIEARNAGAGGVLAILRMIPFDATRVLLDMAVRLGLFVLLEAFDEADLELAARLLELHGVAADAAESPLLVGINCRDLVTLQVVPGRLEALARLLPQQAPRVAESGLDSAVDVAQLATAGYTLALVGSALMRAVSPGLLLREMLHAGRDAVARTAA